MGFFLPLHTAPIEPEAEGNNPQGHGGVGPSTSGGGGQPTINLRGN